MPGPNVPLDFVRAAKFERPGEGQDDDMGFPAQADPIRDGLSAMGLFPGGNLERYISFDGSGNMIFKDPNASGGNELTLNQLLTGTAAVDRGWRRHFLLMGG